MSDDYWIVCRVCGVKFEGDDRTAVDTAFRGHEKEAHSYMTGQEFYERFEKEYYTPDSGRSPDLERHAIEAAKRAAGLK